MSFDNVLNDLMKENGDSNVGLGKAIGVSDMAVLRWRKGEASPSLDNAINIAKYYGISLDKLSGASNELESTKFFQLPILGFVTSDLIHYGLPSGEYIYTNAEEIDNYPRAECYVITTDNSFLFVHQQKQCEDGDYVVYQMTDYVTEYGTSYPVYSLRKYVKNGDMIELLSDNPKDKKVLFRKQNINQLHIVGVVIKRGKKVTH